MDADTAIRDVIARCAAMSTAAPLAVLEPSADSRIIFTVSRPRTCARPTALPRSQPHGHVVRLTVRRFEIRVGGVHAAERIVNRAHAENSRVLDRNA